MEAAAGTHQEHGTVVIKAGRAFDFRSAALFRQRCESFVEAGTRIFIVDFSETEILDSTGLGALFTLFRKLKPQGGRILLAAPTRTVSTVIALTKCDRLFDLHPTVEAALQSVS